MDTQLLLVLMRETALKSVLIAGIVLVALRLLRGATPALRHRGLTVVFVLLAWLPFAVTVPGILPQRPSPPVTLIIPLEKSGKQHAVISQVPNRLTSFR